MTIRLADLPPKARAAVLQQARADGLAMFAARARTPQDARSLPAPYAGPPLRFALPLPASHNRSGQSRHWRTIDAERRAFMAACDARQAAGLLPPPPPVPCLGVRLDCELVVGNLNDDDNAHARTKWGRDWLVTRGYLVSDRPTLQGRPCLVRGTLTQTVRRKAEPTLVLTLTPLPA